MKAATKKIKRKQMELTAKEKALRLVFEDCRKSGKPFKNPNNVIYLGPHHPWYKSRIQNIETGQVAPFTGIGLSQKEAKLDLLRQLKRAGWRHKMSGHHVTVDEKTGRKVSFTRPLYKFQFAPMDSMLPKRLATKFSEYGTPWHSARRWKKQDMLNRKRRIRARTWRRLKKRLVPK